MIINPTEPLVIQEAPIARYDLLTVPLIVPKVPLRQGAQVINSVNRPVLNTFYQFPNPAFVPQYVNSPIPTELPSTETSFVIQPGQANRLTGSSLRAFLSKYLIPAGNV